MPSFIAINGKNTTNNEARASSLERNEAHLLHDDVWPACWERLLEWWRDHGDSSPLHVPLEPFRLHHLQELQNPVTCHSTGSATPCRVLPWPQESKDIRVCLFAWNLKPLGIFLKDKYRQPKNKRGWRVVAGMGVEDKGTQK